MLIWAILDCRYKLDQVGASWCELKGAKEKKRGTGTQSSRLDWDIQSPRSPPANCILEQKLQTSILEESSRLDANPGDWIRVKSVFQEAQLCFKALPTQGPLDPKCLGHEV